MNQKNIGKLIATLRKEKGMTQEDLAEKLSVSNKAVSKWETGKSYPETNKIIQLCILFDISYGEFYNANKISSITTTDENQPSRKHILKKLVPLLPMTLVIILSIVCLFTFSLKVNQDKINNPSTILGTFLLGNELTNSEYIVIERDMSIFRYHQQGQLEKGTIEQIYDQNVYLITFNKEHFYIIYHTDYIDIIYDNKILKAEKISVIPTYINVKK